MKISLFIYFCLSRLHIKKKERRRRKSLTSKHHLLWAFSIKIWLVIKYQLMHSSVHQKKLMHSSHLFWSAKWWQRERTQTMKPETLTYLSQAFLLSINYDPHQIQLYLCFIGWSNISYYPFKSWLSKNWLWWGHMRLKITIIEGSS